MISWENGGVAPIYLCETHVAQVNDLRRDVLAMASQVVSGNGATENAKTMARSGAPPVAEVESRPGIAGSPVSAPAAPVNSAILARDESIANVGREDFEAHGTVQFARPAGTKEESQTESSDLERVCVSRYGERCTAEALVHCPKCGRWFCDAHAEDGRWHGCALPS